jgi:tetratricopeptide (TPR) repeat protein
LRECSAKFYDIRLPLCRMTAHLTFARALGGQAGVHTRLADAMLETLMNRQAAALEKLAQLEADEPDCAVWVRVLKAANTRDYRELANVESPTRLERAAWFGAFSWSVDVDLVWDQLSRSELTDSPIFCRIANAASQSVGTGHSVYRLSIPLELREVGAVYESAHGGKLGEEQLVAELNTLPERCVSQTGNGEPRVRVIGWGQWAMFFQRHLCHAIVQNFHFVNRRWGVREEAREFAAQCDTSFGDMRLYPFVRRFNATDAATYRRAVDGAIALIEDTPHLVAPLCWNYLDYRVSFAEFYRPHSRLQASEWHKHNPPPGTVYHPYPRMHQASLVQRADAARMLEEFHGLAPYDPVIASHMVRLKYGEKPTYEQLVDVYRPVLDYATDAMLQTAQALAERPEEFENLMLKVVALDPSRYFRLSDYFIARTNETKAAEYLQKGIDIGPDAVQAANKAGWLVHYYLRQGETNKARALADMAGEVYSSAGLRAKAEFLEVIGNDAEAFEWYERIEERYGSSSALLAFCLRYQARTGDTRFAKEVEKRIGKLFPNGMQKVTPADFRGPPTEGVMIEDENDLLREAGLKRGDVIVALHGVRVAGMPQYTYVRDNSETPELSLIVWQGQSYREVNASPPERRFGVNFRTYAAGR